MAQEFFQFNKSIINQILNFTISTFDLLFISGQKGSAKREAVEKALLGLEVDNLIFKHFCFENSVIDDFLLNFYDALRNFSLAQRISLKKFATDNFKEKVSHYFKTLSANCIIVVENFEKVQQNIEIIDFLSHLASYVNVKIIIISEKNDKNLFRFKKIKMETLEISPMDRDEFNSKISMLDENIDENLKQKFYQITKGLELYLKMGIQYCSKTGIGLAELLDEFERKETDFEEFMVSKFVSLTPSNYQSLLRTLCALDHPVTKEFLNEYNLGSTNYIDYLSKNFLVSFFKDEMYVKDYFKQYIVKTFSISEKTNYYKNLINIYENELTKSPANRLLRLSRESIRKEIAYLNSLIPSLNSQKSSPFSYLGFVNSAFEKESSKQKSKLSEKFEKIKERKRALVFSNEEKSLLVAKRLKDSDQKSLIEENKKKDRLFIIELINEARICTDSYQYQESNKKLNRALELDYDNEFKIEILILQAKNNKALNDFDAALQNYTLALDFANQTNDLRKFELELELARLNKSLYKFNIAKEQFKKIVRNDSAQSRFRALSAIELGELEEASGELNSAVKSYEQALNLSLGKNKELVCKSYYKLAVLYDEDGNYDEAIKYYEKNYLTSSDKKENRYYSVSLTNLALIYIELSKYEPAGEYLKLALQFDSENNDFENMYFSQKELAKLYSKFDENIAKGYYKQALNTAKTLNDDFKTALVYFEIGEFYYDKEDDAQALANFLNAKKILKNNKNDENIVRINSRIQDIKMRLDGLTFNLVMEKFNK